MTAQPERLGRRVPRTTLSFVARTCIWIGYTYLAVPIDAADEALCGLFARDPDPTAPPDDRLGTRAKASLTSAERRTWASMTKQLLHSQESEDPARGRYP